MIRPGPPPLEVLGIALPAAGPHQEFSRAFPAGLVTVLRGGSDAAREELAHLLLLQKQPAQGVVLWAGEPTGAWSEAKCAEVRAHHLGHVLSAPFLLPALTVAENIAVPIFRLSNCSPEEAAVRSRALLDLVGLEALSQVAAGELGSVEQYAAAMARAVAHRPSVLMVEELDATLEGEGLARTLELLRRLAEHEGVAVVATVSDKFTSQLGVTLVDLSPPPPAS